ncbi:hypothetical protein EIN_377620 [Entamoeba invadens IP1]|uniref:Uncharacterized protein n=1 Tax=Entamoeba invadens IP1 TaxID=370355 RepID=A0A0A1TU76_ENTIV|nr:hypothetical protein EIN_377620 [Entamoeba invadens IP1]ELP83507.1 hypothetical protein EIN_377620 [Entamoeba invadens IP1]|eukprot:XP_004182853.1 hypothetical protein EIN_377620 [Entamoeba invadens IP1]
MLSTFIRSRSYGMHIQSCFYNIHEMTDCFIFAVEEHVEKGETTILNVVPSFCQWVVDGDKTKIRLWEIIGKTFSSIWALSTCKCGKCEKSQINMLWLLRFLVSSEVFKNSLYSEPIKILCFDFIKNRNLFVRTCLLLEQLIDTDGVVMTFDDEFCQLLSSLDLVDTGVALGIIIKTLTKKTERNREDAKNLLKYGIVNKILKLLSLSTYSLAIIHLLQNSCISEKDEAVKKVRNNVENESKTYPEVDLTFTTTQGVHSADVVSDVLFFLMILFDLISQKKAIKLVKESEMTIAMIQLHDSIDIDSLPDGYTPLSQHPLHALFGQYIHFISMLPKEDIMKNGMIDIAMDDISQAKECFKAPLFSFVEAVVRECNLQEKIYIGKTCGAIKSAISMLYGKMNCDTHVIFDALGCLIRKNEENSKELIECIPESFDKFLKRCERECVSSCVLLRSLLLNILFDKSGGNAMQQYQKIVNEMMPNIFKQLVDHLKANGVNGHTACCLNTIVLILGIHPNVDLFIQNVNNTKIYFEEINKLVQTFEKRYTKDDQIEVLLEITMTTKKLWMDAVKCVKEE